MNTPTYGNPKYFISTLVFILSSRCCRTSNSPFVQASCKNNPRINRGWLIICLQTKDPTKQFLILPSKVPFATKSEFLELFTISKKAGRKISNSFVLCKFRVCVMRLTNDGRNRMKFPFANNVLRSLE